MIQQEGLGTGRHVCAKAGGVTHSLPLYATSASSHLWVTGGGGGGQN
jgi:hypothetical protein